MKLKHIVKRGTSITAATSIGTTYYTASLDDVISAMRSQGGNIWIYASFKKLGWDAIDFAHNLYGSQVIDNVLYLCITDGHDIDVNGESVNPEEALEDYDVSELSAYIQPADADIIRKYITQYEIKTPDFNNWADDLISDYYFTDLVRDAQEFADF